MNQHTDSLIPLHLLRRAALVRLAWCGVTVW